jgi:cobalt-zinc-cadmium efflux system membrane fusion protein
MHIMKLRTAWSLAIVFLTLLSCNRHEEHEVAHAFVLSDAMLKQTQFADAVVKQVRSELKLFGKVTANSSKMVQVFPVVGGNVTEVNVELGDYVEKGKRLAVIRSGEIAEFDRERKDAINDVSLAEKNVQIAKELFESKLNSERDVIAAQKELEKAQSELKRIREVFSIYGLTSESEYVVKAPISGFIIEKSITHDMQLRPDRSENIFTIAEIDDIWVIANVNETDISLIKLGYEAEVHTLSYSGRVFKGKVDRIFNVLDPETKTMKVRITLANKDLALKPEMNATVIVRYAQEEKKIAIPSSAVIFDKSRHYVMVYRGTSDIETRPIEIFKGLGDTTYVASGLKEGERVISKNQLLIYDALND